MSAKVQIKIGSLYNYGMFFFYVDHFADPDLLQ